MKRFQLGLEPSPLVARAQMSALVELLNPLPHLRRPSHFAPIRAELLRLVEMWNESGPNLYKLLARNPELKERGFRGWATVIPTSTGRAHLEHLPGPPNTDRKHPEAVALGYFIRLITNPYWELLGGPCPRCENYFLKKTKKQKVYCSQRCGSTVTAAAAIRARRKREHQDKLARAQQYIDKWRESHTRTPWKPWVQRQTGFSLNWLTRAANKREIQAPDNRVTT